jgi:hypothetical protein
MPLLSINLIGDGVGIIVAPQTQVMNPDKMRGEYGKLMVRTPWVCLLQHKNWCSSLTAPLGL